MHPHRMHTTIPLSPSALRDADCLARFHRARILREPDATTNPMRDAGSTLHAAIAAYLVHLAATKRQTDTDEALSIGVNAAVGLTPDARAQHDALWADWSDDFVRDTPDDALVEQRFAFDADWEPCEFRSPAARWRGVLDLGYRRPGEDYGVIRDWKTGWKMPTGDLAENVQIRSYAHAALCRQEFAGVVSVETRLEFLRLHRTIRATIPADVAAAFPAWIAPQIERIARAERDDRWPASVTPDCSTCPWRNRCPEYLAAPTAPIPTETAGDWEAAVRALAALEIQARDIKDALRVRLDACGPIAAGEGRVYRLIEKQRREVVDVAALVRALTQRGVSAEAIADAMRLGLSDAKPLIGSVVARGQKGKAFDELCAACIEDGAIVVKQIISAGFAKTGEEEVSE